MKVLHIDDNPSFLEITKIYFEKKIENVEIDGALSVKQAIECFEQEHYDGVILDYFLQNECGMDFVSYLRKKKGTLTPVLLLTGSDSRQVVIDALNAGVNYFVEKGSSISEIYQEMEGFFAQLALKLLQKGEIPSPELEPPFDSDSYDYELVQKIDVGEQIEQVIWDLSRKINIISETGEIQYPVIHEASNSIAMLQKELSDSNKRIREIYQNFKDKLSQNYQSSLRNSNGDSSGNKIKNVWIISESGLSFYEYYESGEEPINSELFAGFVSAMSSFVKTLMTRELDTVHLKDWTIYFIKVKSIIVTTVVRKENLDQAIVTRLLEFLGERFNELFEEKLLKNAIVNKTEIREHFDFEVQFLLSDPEILLGLKAEIVNRYINDTISNKVSRQFLFWKLIQLYINESSHDTNQAMGQFFDIVRIYKQNETINPEKLDEVSAILEKAQQIFQFNLPPELQTLLVLMDEEQLFNHIIDNFLSLQAMATNYLQGIRQLEETVQPQGVNQDGSIQTTADPSEV